MRAVEWLRWLETCDLSDPWGWAREVAYALAEIDEPPALVLACKRLVSRNLESGLVWRLASEALQDAEDPSFLVSFLEDLEAEDPWLSAVYDLDASKIVGVWGYSLDVARLRAVRPDLLIREVNPGSERSLSGVQVLALGTSLACPEKALFPKGFSNFLQAAFLQAQLRLVIEPMALCPVAVFSEALKRLASVVDPHAPGSYMQRRRLDYEGVSVELFKDVAVGAEVVPASSLAAAVAWRPAPELFI